MHKTLLNPVLLAFSLGVIIVKKSSLYMFCRKIKNKEFNEFVKRLINYWYVGKLVFQTNFIPSRTQYVNSCIGPGRLKRDYTSFLTNIDELEQYQHGKPSFDDYTFKEQNFLQTEDLQYKQGVYTNSLPSRFHP